MNAGPLQSTPTAKLTDPSAPAPAPPLESIPGRSPRSLEEPAAVSHWRERCLVLGFGVLSLVIGLRLVQLQWLQHDQFARGARRMQTWEELLPARPGDILDRHGRVLATSTTAVSLFVDPHFVEDPDRLAAQLAEALHLDRVTLAARLHSSAGKRFVWIKRRLSAEESARVRALQLPRHVAGLREEFLRHYPQGSLAAHVLGLRDIDNRGRGGLEEGAEAILAGEPGFRRWQRDAHGFVLTPLDEGTTPPRPGKNLVTTLDSVMQIAVEQRLEQLIEQYRPRSCAAIVMSPANAEVLAMASRPTFDPNHPELAPADGWKNQALASIFEPGSTFKPFIVAWCLEQGVLDPEETLDCHHGAYRMGRRVLHDHHAYGNLSVTDVLVKSSNIGMAIMGERLGNEGLYQTCTAFGFGRPTGIGLPGELPGLLRPLADWTSYSTGSIPMGQELSVTPLQLITAHAALANGGRLITPRLTLAQSDASSSAPRPVTSPVITQIVSEPTARWLVAGPMREVVTRGTGQQAKIPGYSVFGKTGTAQMVDPATGRYSHSRHICSFVCGAPASDPQILVLVMIEEPHGPGVQYGGTVAAPAARDILESALVRLEIPPDLTGEARPLAERPSAPSRR